MTKSEIKEILEKQLYRLDKASGRDTFTEDLTCNELAQLTEAMLKTADFLLDLEMSEEASKKIENKKKEVKNNA